MGSRSEVLAAQGDLAPALLDGLADASDQVVLQALDVQASLSREDPHFRVFMVRGMWLPRAQLARLKCEALCRSVFYATFATRRCSWSRVVA